MKIGSTRRNRTRRRRARIVLVLLLLLALIALFVVLRRREHAPPEVKPAVQVEIGRAERKNLPITLDAIGQATAVSEADVAAPEVARVVRIYVAIGDRVQRGQPLIKLDQTAFAARRRQAEVVERSASRGFERTRRLVAEGILPRKDLDSAAADLARATADLEQSRHTEYLAVLRSPIDGVVSMLNATLSSPVDITVPVVSIVNPAGFEALFQVTPSDAARIKPGAKVTLGTTNDTTRLVLGTGTITGVSAAIDSTTRTVLARASISNTIRPLSDGELVTGRIVLRELENVVVVPIAAVVPGVPTRVFVIDSSGIAHATVVTLGSRTETEVQITTGLRGGERVATIGAYSLVDSARVITGHTR